MLYLIYHRKTKVKMPKNGGHPNSKNKNFKASFLNIEKKF